MKIILILVISNVVAHYTIINLCNYYYYLWLLKNYYVFKILFLGTLYSFHNFHIYFNVPIINKKHHYTSNIFNINLGWHFKTCRIKYWLHLRWVMLLCFHSMFKDVFMSLLIFQASFHYHFHIYCYYYFSL